jgi:hypothetical protein
MVSISFAVVFKDESLSWRQRAFHCLIGFLDCDQVAAEGQAAFVQKFIEMRGSVAVVFSKSFWRDRFGARRGAAGVNLSLSRCQVRAG